MFLRSLDGIWWHCGPFFGGAPLPRSPAARLKAFQDIEMAANGEHGAGAAGAQAGAGEQPKVFAELLKDKTGLEVGQWGVVADGTDLVDVVQEMFSSAGVKVQKTEAKTESEDYDVVRFRCKGKALTRDGQAQLAALVRAGAQERQATGGALGVPLSPRRVPQPLGKCAVSCCCQAV